MSKTVTMKFSTGDMLFAIVEEPNETRQQCPVCIGELRLAHKSPQFCIANNHRYYMPGYVRCPYCNGCGTVPDRNAGKTWVVGGTVQVYCYAMVDTCLRLTGEGGDSYDEDDVFATEAEAEAEATKRNTTKKVK